jgi:adenylate cyclase
VSKGPESKRFEGLLRQRGVGAEGNPEVEQQIFDRYMDHCAVMVLDSSGFTRLTQSHGIIHFLSLVVSMRDLVEPLCDKHGAIAHWAEADNVYAIFKTAGDGLRCAMEIQTVVMASNVPRPETSRLPVCIGLGTGRMLRIGGENVYGDEMNLASKLGEDIADPDEILITPTVLAEVGDDAPGVERLEQRISGVDIEYYRVIMP